MLFIQFVTEPIIECRKMADVVFVVDSSSNLLYKDFQTYILGTITEIIRHLDVDLGRTRVAAVYFANTAKVQFLFLDCITPKVTEFYNAR